MDLAMSSAITSFPDEIMVHIIARVPRSNYPSLSLVSKRFRSLVASLELYKRRSLLACTEHCLYVALYSFESDENRLYILHKNRLVPISSLPAMPIDGSFVVVGSKIYAIGGVYGMEMSSSKVLTVDCRSHTVQSLPDLPMAVGNVIGNVVEKKVFVVGVVEFESGLSPRVMVFDTETAMWESEMVKKPEMEIGQVWYSCVVMEDKMYLSDHVNSFVYGTGDGKWEGSDEVLDSEKWKYGCVVDEVLYYYDCGGKKLRAFDSKKRCWMDVKGVEEMLDDATGSLLSAYTVNHGGKLAVFVTRQLVQSKEIWCAEISIEKRQGGEIWGNVEWCEIVIDGNFHIQDCVSVVV